MLFKPTLNAKMEEIRKYVPVSAATSFGNISAFIQSSEVSYIIPLLGEELYEQLLAYYTTPTTLPAGVTTGNKTQFDTLIEYAQRALINLTYYSGFDFINTIMNDAGFHRQESDTEKGLYKYQEDAVKSGFRNNGFNALDTMLGYIESNITTFPNFKTSTNYTLRKSSIIPDTHSFDLIFDISGSRLVFLKLSRFIAQVEDFEISALLGAKLYNLVKTEIVKDIPDGKITALIPYLRRAIAYLSVARASFQLGINVTDKGLFFESQASTLLNSAVSTPLTDQQYYLLATKSEKTGNEYLELLRGFLLANATDYPLYVSPGGSPFVRDNKTKSTTWV
ncbi:MAG: DUF6712 family protein [Bacteroidales bacterium]|jgi:hypothetical protein